MLVGVRVEAGRSSETCISSQHAPDPISWSLPSLVQTRNVTALQFDDTDRHMTVVGIVLGSTTNAALGVPTSLDTATVSKLYMAYDDGTASTFSLGPSNGPSATTLFVHDDFDTVNETVRWESNVSSRTLPATLSYMSRPGWWPAGAGWPWTGPDRTPRNALGSSHRGRVR